MLASSLWLAAWLARAELGDLATWVGAFANLATVVLAVVASLVGYRVYRIESTRDQRAEAERRERAVDERRSQAQLVSVWFGRSERVETTIWGTGTATKRVQGWAAYVLNASNLPIYDVGVTFLIRQPNGHHRRPYLTKHFRVAPPHQEPRTVDMPDQLADEAGQVAWDVDVRLSFRDSAGRSWVRDEQGYLHEVRTPAWRRHDSPDPTEAGQAEGPQAGAHGPSHNRR